MAMNAYARALMVALADAPVERAAWERFSREEEAACLRVWLLDMDRPVAEVFALVPAEVARVRAMMDRVRRPPPPVGVRVRRVPWERERALAMERRRTEQAFRWLVLMADGVPEWAQVSASMDQVFGRAVRDVPMKVHGGWGPAFWLHTVRMVMRGPMFYARPGRAAVRWNDWPEYCAAPGVYGPRVFEIERELEVEAGEFRRARLREIPRVSDAEWRGVDFGDGRGLVDESWEVLERLVNPGKERSSGDVEDD